MKNIKRLTFGLLLSTVLLYQTSCKKDWLDVKSDKSLAVPSKLKDLQAILDYTEAINGYATLGQQFLSEIGEISSDNIFVTNTTFNSLNATANTKWQANSYIFKNDIFEGSTDPSIFELWNRPYQRVYYANVVLDAIPKIDPSEQEVPAYNSIKGTALFIRSYAFSLLLDTYSKPFENSTASIDLGIPLRLNSDLNIPSVRANVKECYEKIITDLIEAVKLLPQSTTIGTRPSKATALALLSRVYLTMSDYTKAEYYASECLKVNDALIDYSKLSTVVTAPFARFNIETLYQDIRTSVFLGATRGRIDTVLYQSYAANDLRKVLFFKKQTDGYYSFKGSYDGSAKSYYGVAKDEVYLIQSECLVRKNDIAGGMSVLNKLLKTRWAKNPDGSSTYVDLTASNAEDALQIVLSERRKELVFRGIRWMDLRRLNKDSKFQVVVKRIVNGTTYELMPNTSRYVFPIPDDIIRISGMEQNGRD